MGNVPYSIWTEHIYKDDSFSIEFSFNQSDFMFSSLLALMASFATFKLLIRVE